MHSQSLRGHIARLTAIVALAGAGFMLAGCVNSTPLDDLEYANPSGVSPFDAALYKNYAFLARSFGDVGVASQSVFDFTGSWSLNETEHDVADLANTYAAKAVEAASGAFVSPEPALNPEAHAYRDRLVRALNQARETFPRDAARAQADYDCWMLNAKVPSQKSASERCRVSLDTTLPLLESETDIKPPAPAPESPAAPVEKSGDLPVGAQPAQTAPHIFTVYFDFDSWTLTAPQLQTLDQAAKEAKSGASVQVRIIGHTDTSGPAGYNKRLSLHRANVVKEALVDMGVKRKAILTKGVGEADLAVKTEDNVKEAKNRRAVITITKQSRHKDK